jgi:DNA-binding MarR family transcriptional regulator
MGAANDDDPVPTDVAMPELVTFLLRRAAALASQDLQASLAETNIRPIQFAILNTLAARPGVRQSQLSPALGIRRTNLVPLLAELETRGLCERRPVPGDRRASALFLTESGRAVWRACGRDAAAHEARLSGRIGPGGRDILASLLQRLGDPALDPPAMPPLDTP